MLAMTLRNIFVSFDVQSTPFLLISVRNTCGKLKKNPNAYCEGRNGDPSTTLLFMVAIISGGRNAQLVFVFLTKKFNI